MDLQKKYLSDVPLIALVTANTVPLYGVLFVGWDAFAVVALYWSENLIVGFYNIIKMAIVKADGPMEHLSKLFLIPFFIFHYGAFCAVHGFFVLAMFAGMAKQGKTGSSGPIADGGLFFMSLLYAVIKQLLLVMTPTQLICVGALALSHGVSFVYNFLIKNERGKADVKSLMGSPYSRIVVMHIAIIFGAFLMMVLKTPASIVIVLVIMKTYVDIKLHLHEHKKFKTRRRANVMT